MGFLAHLCDLYHLDRGVPVNCQCQGPTKILWAKRDGKNRPARYCKQCGAFGEWLNEEEARAFYRIFFTKDKPAKKVHQVHPPKQMTLRF